MKARKMRMIKDGGGNMRKMELMHVSDGLEIYEEVELAAVVAFFDGDSLDTSGEWSSDLARLRENFPQSDIPAAY